jgi:hypothetical protein
MCRIQGRIVRPASLQTRRVFKALGVDFIRVPRRLNPFAVARSIRKLALNPRSLSALKGMLAKPVAPSLPDSTTEPRPDADQRAA